MKSRFGSFAFGFLWMKKVACSWSLRLVWESADEILNVVFFKLEINATDFNER